jgi:hypothetical protein
VAEEPELFAGDISVATYVVDPEVDIRLGRGLICTRSGQCAERWSPTLSVSTLHGISAPR